MGKRQLPPEEPAEIHEVMLRDALEERYLAYALSTIMHRALPDARDGLKPVHRRILYGMRLLRLDPGTPFKKSAKIVGDVMGSFHPHGDQAIYDAMVRLAQDFASRYPLVDGQGNFGNIDGDNPAAYRYTEARMTEVARLLLEGIDEDGVEFRPNYDGETKEPVVLPGGFPNLLANGSQGIAVGMATSIPPHNAAELCDAALHLIEKPDAKSKSLLKWVKGPDFPTGGIIVDFEESIAEAYMTGRGSFRTRAKWTQEEGARGTWVVVITEIPMAGAEVPAGREDRRAAERKEVAPRWRRPRRVGRRRPPRDRAEIPRGRSGADDGIAVPPHRAREQDLAEPQRADQGQDPQGGGACRVPARMARPSARRAGPPLQLPQEPDREPARNSGGYLIAYLNIDKVIKIIRTEDEPKPALIKAFKLTEVQADAILNMRLRSLRKLEEFEIRTEDKNLRGELKGLKALLASETEQWSKVGEQVRKVRDLFGPKTPLGKRRTMFADAPEHDLAAIEEAFVEREPCTVVISEKGWVRTLKGHVEDISGLAFKTDDKLDHAFFAETTSKLLVFATNGKFYSLDVAKLPGGRGHGEPIRMFIDMEQDAAIVSLFVNKGERKFLIASSEGQGFVVKEEDCVGNTRKGKQVLNVTMPNEACAITTVAGDTVAVIGTNHKMVLFPLDQVPEMARGRGVRLQKYSGAKLSDVAVFELKAGLTWKDSAGREQSMSAKELSDWRGNRADAGRLAHGLPKSNKFLRGVE